jgi:hypothetical protein
MAGLTGQRLVRDALGFYSQVPVEQPVTEATVEVFEPEPVVAASVEEPPQEEEEVDADALAALDDAAPRRRGRPRKGESR